MAQLYDGTLIPAVFWIETLCKCDGCVRKMNGAIKQLKRLDGVTEITADYEGKNVTVRGKVDPTVAKQILEQNIQKNVSVVSPHPNHKKKKLVLNLPLQCQGCIETVSKSIWKFNGVEAVDIDGNRDLVKVKGTKDPKELEVYIKENLKKTVQVLPRRVTFASDLCHVYPSN